MQLQGHTFLITGGGSGLGAACACTFVGGGANVVIADVNPQTGEQLTAALPKEMTTGLDLKELGDILEHRRDALYPETVRIDIDAGKRVEQSLIAGGPIKPGANIAGLYDTSIAGG